jgi:hypothetical protein
MRRNPIPCLQCGTPFITKASPAEMLTGRGKYCGRECVRLSKFRGEAHDCLHCGRLFHVPPNRANDGRGRYCGKPCADAAKVVVTDPVAHFWEHVVKREGCWGWTWHTDAPGYGVIHFQKRLILAHRLSWELHCGPIPDGLCVLHECDNPPCSNPAHLFLGTKPDNNRDRAAKGRSALGSRSGAAKLTETLVTDLRRRRAAGATIISLATELGMDRATVSDAISGKSWSHVPQD